MSKIFLSNRRITYWVFLFVVLMFTLLFSGCGGSQTKKVAASTILPTKLTARESVLFQQMGIERSLIFDVRLLDANINWGEIWVDQYENGKFKQLLLNLRSSVTIDKVNEPSHIVWSIHEPELSSQVQKWVLAFGNGHVSYGIRIPSSGIATTSRTANEIRIEKGKTLTLGVIARGKNTANIPEDFFVNEEAGMKELLKNDNVYVLRCSFK